MGTRLIEAVTVTKLAPLLIFVGVGMFFVDPSAMAWPGFPDSDSLGAAVLLLIFAYAGVEVALAPSGEVRNPAPHGPARHLSRARHHHDAVHCDSARGAGCIWAAAGAADGGATGGGGGALSRRPRAPR